MLYFKHVEYNKKSAGSILQANRDRLDLSQELLAGLFGASSAAVNQKEAAKPRLKRP